MRFEAVKVDGGEIIRLRDISLEAVVDLVRAETFTWVDIDITSVQEPILTDLLVNRLDFHPATVEDCIHLAPFHQPKLDEEQDYKFITFLYYDPRPSGELEVREINIYISDTYVITVHRHPMTQFLASFREPPHHITEYRQRAIMYLHHILDRVIDSFAPLLKTLQRQSDQLELSVLSTRRHRILAFPLKRHHQEELSDMRHILKSRQALVMLRRTLAAELSIIEHVIQEYDYEGAPEASEEIAIYFRDISDHVRKYLEIIESEERTMTHLMEVSNLVTGHRTNEIIYVLTILSTIMLPLNIIVGFFGMNFDNLFLAHHPMGIWLVTISMVAISFLLVAFFRYKGWL